MLFVHDTEEGHCTGGIVAFGCKRVKKGRLNKRNQEVCELEVNEEETAIVRLIFQKYVYEGYGAKRICNYFVEHNIIGRNGKNIPNITIGRMIRNKGYTGYLINGNVEKECPELRIIEPEVFEKVQELRDARRREKGEDADSYSPHALLCGKVFCAHCGNRLNIKPNSNRPKKNLLQSSRWLCYRSQSRDVLPIRIHRFLLIGATLTGRP